jgi:hypothetical protein
MFGQLHLNDAEIQMDKRLTLKKKEKASSLVSKNELKKIFKELKE